MKRFLKDRKKAKKDEEKEVAGDATGQAPKEKKTKKKLFFFSIFSKKKKKDKQLENSNANQVPAIGFTRDVNIRRSRSCNYLDSVRNGRPATQEPSRKSRDVSEDLRQQRSKLDEARSLNSLGGSLSSGFHDVQSPGNGSGRIVSREVEEFMRSMPLLSEAQSSGTPSAHQRLKASSSLGLDHIQGPRPLLLHPPGGTLRSGGDTGRVGASAGPSGSAAFQKSCTDEPSGLGKLWIGQEHLVTFSDGTTKMVSWTIEGDKIVGSISGGRKEMDTQTDDLPDSGLTIDGSLIQNEAGGNAEETSNEETRREPDKPVVVSQDEDKNFVREETSDRRKTIKNDEIEADEGNSEDVLDDEETACKSVATESQLPECDTVLDSSGDQWAAPYIELTQESTHELTHELTHDSTHGSTHELTHDSTPAGEQDTVHSSDKNTVKGCSTQLDLSFEKAKLNISKLDNTGESSDDVRSSTPITSPDVAEPDSHSLMKSSAESGDRAEPTSSPRGNCVIWLDASNCNIHLTPMTLDTGTLGSDSSGSLRRHGDVKTPGDPRGTSKLASASSEKDHHDLDRTSVASPRSAPRGSDKSASLKWKSVSDLRKTSSRTSVNDSCSSRTPSIKDPEYASSMAKKFGEVTARITAMAAEAASKRENRDIILQNSNPGFAGSGNWIESEDRITSRSWSMKEKSRSSEEILEDRDARRVESHWMTGDTLITYVQERRREAGHHPVKRLASLDENSEHQSGFDPDSTARSDVSDDGKSARTYKIQISSSTENKKYQSAYDLRFPEDDSASVCSNASSHASSSVFNHRINRDRTTASFDQLHRPSTPGGSGSRRSSVKSGSLQRAGKKTLQQQLSDIQQRLDHWHKDLTSKNQFSNRCSPESTQGYEGGMDDCSLSSGYQSELRSRSEQHAQS